MKLQGWRGFGWWALVGGLFALSWLAVLSIGVLILPIGIIALVIVARRTAFWPEVLGISQGIGAALLRIGSMHYGIPQCKGGDASQGIESSSGYRAISPGETIQFSGRLESCVSIDYRMWLISGAAIIVLGLALYAIAHHNRNRHHTQTF